LLVNCFTAQHISQLTFNFGRTIKERIIVPKIIHSLKFLLKSFDKLLAVKIFCSVIVAMAVAVVVAVVDAVVVVLYFFLNLLVQLCQFTC
jgi:hypothetical protein